MYDALSNMAPIMLDNLKCRLWHRTCRLKEAGAEMALLGVSSRKVWGQYHVEVYVFGVPYNTPNPKPNYTTSIQRNWDNKIGNSVAIVLGHGREAERSCITTTESVFGTLGGCL